MLQSQVTTTAAFAQCKSVTDKLTTSRSILQDGYSQQTFYMIACPEIVCNKQGCSIKIKQCSNS